MKAKDTVMGTDQMIKIVTYPTADDFSLVEAQAKISFKAGYEQHKKEVEMTTISLAEMCAKHRKAGIKEGGERVYDMETGRETKTSDKGNIWIRFPAKEWQALKEDK